METISAPPRAEPARAAPIALSPWWAFFAAVALAIPLAAMMVRYQPSLAAPPLPVYSSLPDFSLVDQAGRPFARKDLLGRAWAADLIFTHCSDACPRLTARMKLLQVELQKSGDTAAAGLLSISVDPARDTPAAMKAYADSTGADPRLWRFLTGDETQIERAVVDGFKMGIDKSGDPKSQAFDIMHGEKFVLIDSLGRIRGYYEVGTKPELQRVLDDLRLLARGEHP